MIGHYHEGVELVTVETRFAIQKRLNHQACDLRLPQKDRPASALVQDSIHDSKRGAACLPCRRESAVCRQRSMQTESDEYGLTGHVPVRKTALVIAHVN